MSLKVFIDSDVIISSLISTTGAAFYLIHQIDTIDSLVSNNSVDEIEKVIERLSLNAREFKKLIGNKVSVIEMQQTINEVKKQYATYVLDINDAHIVAGAVKGKVRFLVSYNIKHFKADKLKEDFGIILITPANLLQYIRSI
ncbi:MAG: PIN domain-containing protein [Candidatus Levyibacteriota bacterium]